jgi:hypothetical protein
MMFTTLFTARIADAGTNSANFVCFIAAKAHELRGRITNCGALHVELNAASHHFNIFFSCT